MTKPLKLLVFVLVATVALGAGVWLLLTTPQSDGDAGDDGLYLETRTPAEVQSVEVENQYGAYTVTKEGEDWHIYDIPDALVNTEYLDMLLRPASSTSPRSPMT